jgi:hypothetical protein
MTFGNMSEYFSKERKFNMEMMKNGNYVYKFSGNSMKSGRPFKIEGVGTLIMAGNQITDGHHRSSVLQMVSTAASLVTSHFTVSGTTVYHQKEKNWSVELTFVEQDVVGRPAQILVGTYRAVCFGEGKYWVFSTGAKTVETGSDVPAFELSSVELICVD